jgi:hypothetical protein
MHLESWNQPLGAPQDLLMVAAAETDINRRGLHSNDWEIMCGPKAYDPVDQPPHLNGNTDQPLDGTYRPYNFAGKTGKGY